MVSKNANGAVDYLSMAISERNIRKTAESLREFILTYFPDSSNPSDINSKKRVLDAEFGLIKGEFLPIATAKQEGIKDLLKYFDSDTTNRYLFAFKVNSLSYAGLYFDKNNNTVSFSDEHTGSLEVQKRFIDTYGSETVQLKIRNNKEYKNNRFYIPEK